MASGRSRNAFLVERSVESLPICDVNAARGFPRSEGARLWLYRHEPEDVRLATIVEVRLRHDYLVTDDPEGVKHLQHLIAADKIGCAFHHHDSTALHGVDDFLDRYQRHGPTKENEVEAFFAELVVAIANRGGVQCETKFFG